MSHRRMTPKGQMSSNGSGPAIMMMKPHIRATFMPDPPLRYIPPPKKGESSSHSRRNYGGKTTLSAFIPSTTNANGNEDATDDKENGDIKPNLITSMNSPNKNNPSNSTTTTTTYHKTSSLSGVSNLMIQFERTQKPPKRTLGSTPASAKRLKHKRRTKANNDKLAPLIEEYQKHQKKCAGELDGMNCYNTLFVGRLAYETTERKLLRELETFGPVKDLKLIMKRSGAGGSGSEGAGNSAGVGGKNTEESRGYAFVEFENEEDMKRAYRGADGMRLDGREIVVDVERGHTVPNWLPRRLGGGKGGTRLGGKNQNITAPGRFDPSKQSPMSRPPPGPHYPPHHPMNHPNMNHPPHHPMHNNMNHHPMHHSSGPFNHPMNNYRGGGGGPPPGGHRGPGWDRDRYNNNRDGPPPNHGPWGGGGRPGGPPPGGGGGRNRFGPGGGGGNFGRPPPHMDRYGSGGGGGGRYPPMGQPGSGPGPGGSGGGGYGDRDRDRDRYGGGGEGGRFDRKRTRSRSNSPPARRRFR